MGEGDLEGVGGRCRGIRQGRGREGERKEEDRRRKNKRHKRKRGKTNTWSVWEKWRKEWGRWKGESRDGKIFKRIWEGKGGGGEYGKKGRKKFMYKRRRDRNEEDKKLE
jgi:hypothetical protein